MKLHVLIADDHALLRKGCIMILKKHDPEWEVSEAGDGREAITKAGEIHPDVILMDYLMPRLDGIKAALKIRKLYPEIHIIMVSSDLSAEVVNQTIVAGVRGFVPKGSTDNVLLEAIHAVINGEYYFSPQLRDMSHNKEVFGKNKNTKNDSIFSQREKEVLVLLARDYTSSDIAEKLVISKRTVDFHRTQLLARSGSKTTAGLIRFALKSGILEV